MLDYQRFREIGELYACGKTEQARYLLMEMQSKSIALRDEIAILKTRVSVLEDALNLSRNLYLEHGFYWLKINGLRQGPFCPACYDGESALIHLDKRDENRVCPLCGEVFALPEKFASANLRDVGKTSKILIFAPNGAHY